MATGMSADGHVSALHQVPVEAGVWSAAGGWVDLPSPYASGCDTDEGGAFDISDDASVVVGLMWNGCGPAAFRWTEAGGTQELEILGVAHRGGTLPPTNRATVVSGDGQIAAGFAEYRSIDRSPARWNADGTGELLAPDDHSQPGEVLSIDYDGNTLGVQRGYDGYLWTVDGGFTNLGRLDSALPTDPVYPNALSADGQVAFGGVGSDFFTIPIAFVWTEAAGMRSLQRVAEAAGVPIEKGYILTNVLSVSEDGSVVVGSVVVGSGYSPDFMPRAFVLHVPVGTWQL